MSAIHSVEEFMTTFQVGDVFWFISSCTGRGPVSIEKGQIRKFTVSDFGDIVVHFLDNNKVFHYFVSDLTNGYHGVFCNSTEALLALIDRQDQYQNDTSVKAQIERQNSAIYFAGLIDDCVAYNPYDDDDEDEDEFDYDEDEDDIEDDEEDEDDDDFDDFEDEDDEDDEYDPDPTNM